MSFHKNILQLDSDKEIIRICDFIVQQVSKQKKEGLIVGLSGGVDSAICAELCMRAVGKQNILGLLLPEKESDPTSRDYAQRHSNKMEISTQILDITPVLNAFGSYIKRDELIKSIFPEYDSTFVTKITLPPDLLNRESINFFSLSIKGRNSKIKNRRLTKKQLLGIIAATSTKQRTRMMYLHYFAEKLNYLVCGTTNRTEMLLGYFVKFGDGGVDLEPIAHLYKTQVYQLAKKLGVIEEIIKRTPSPDTYSFSVSDEEYYFRMPFDILDLLLCAWENNRPINEVCKIMDLQQEQVSRAFRDFTAKYNSTKHLRELPPSID